MSPDRILWIEFRSYLQVELELSVWTVCIHEIPQILRAKREEVIPVVTAYNKCVGGCSVIFMHGDTYRLLSVLTTVRC